MGLVSDYTKLVMILICPLLTKPNPINSWRKEDLNYLPLKHAWRYQSSQKQISQSNSQDLC